jgi:hypothetical protein
MQVAKLRENAKEFAKKFSSSQHWPVLLTPAAEQF